MRLWCIRMAIFVIDDYGGQPPGAFFRSQGNRHPGASPFNPFTWSFIPILWRQRPPDTLRLSRWITNALSSVPSFPPRLLQAYDVRLCAHYRSFPNLSGITAGNVPLIFPASHYQRGHPREQPLWGFWRFADPSWSDHWNPLGRHKFFFRPQTVRGASNRAREFLPCASRSFFIMVSSLNLVL